MFVEFKVSCYGTDVAEEARIHLDPQTEHLRGNIKRHIDDITALVKTAKLPPKEAPWTIFTSTMTTAVSSFGARRFALPVGSSPSSRLAPRSKVCRKTR